jgi:hypothetical protein
MTDAPERIWMPHDGVGPWFIKPVQPATEYIRADLAPTDAQVMAHPKVRALVEALRPFNACVFDDNGDVTISTGHVTSRDWLCLKAALRDLT